MDNNKIGEYAFLAGIAIAVLTAIATTIIDPAQATMALVVLGVLVGLLNIKEKQVQLFLIAAIAFLTAAIAEPSLGSLPEVGIYLSAIIKNIATFVAPATVIVAAKAIYSMGTSE